MPHELSKARRCEILNIPRSTAYFQPKGVSEHDLKVMRLPDEFVFEIPP